MDLIEINPLDIKETKFCEKKNYKEPIWNQVKQQTQQEVGFEKVGYAYLCSTRLKRGWGGEDCWEGFVWVKRGALVRVNIINYICR